MYLDVFSLVKFSIGLKVRVRGLNYASGEKKNQNVKSVPRTVIRTRKKHEPVEGARC